MNINEKELIEEARERIAFKRHAYTYLAVTLLSWALWFIMGGQSTDHLYGMWPLWVTLGWGFGVLMHYWSAYKNDSQAVERELEKIKKERNLMG
jgi:hypothetical protein